MKSIIITMLLFFSILGKSDASNVCYGVNSFNCDDEWVDISGVNVDRTDVVLRIGGGGGPSVNLQGHSFDPTVMYDQYYSYASSSTGILLIVIEWHHWLLGEVNSSSMTIQGNKHLTFSGQTFCSNENAVDLRTTILPIPNSVQGSGISGSILNPEIATIGSNAITANLVVASNGCGVSKDFVVTVLQAEEAQFISQPPSLLDSDQPLLLSTYVTPAGGSFIGSGINGQNFDAGFAGAGVHSVEYNYTALNGCNDTAGTTITVTHDPGIPSQPNIDTNLSDIKVSVINIGFGNIILYYHKSVCGGENRTFHVQNPVAGDTYNWYIDSSGTILPIGTGSTLNWTAPTYRTDVLIYVKRETFIGVESTARQIYMTCFPSPVAASRDTICFSDSLNYELALDTSGMALDHSYSPFGFNFNTYQIYDTLGVIDTSLVDQIRKYEIYEEGIAVDSGRYRTIYHNGSKYDGFEYKIVDQWLNKGYGVDYCECYSGIGDATVSHTPISKMAINGDSSISSGEAIYFINAGSFADTIVWDFQESPFLYSNQVSTDNGNQWKYFNDSSSIGYDIKMTSIDRHGCSDMVTKDDWIKVSHWTLETPEVHVSDEHFMIYPNPCIGTSFILRYGEGKGANASIALYTSIGRKVLSEIEVVFTDQMQEVKLPAPTSRGVYYLEIDTGTEVLVQKLVIQ